MNDGDGGTASATISITVNRTSLPTGQAFRVTTDMNKAASGQLNGSNVQNLPMTFAISAHPANGVVSLDSATGAFTYQPAAGYWNLRPGDDLDLDSFSYTITDSFGTSTPTRVELAVNWVNTPPTAKSESVEIDEDETLEIDLSELINDVDVTNSVLTLSVENGPASGTLSISNQVWTYTPNAGFVGSDAFTYKVNDGDGGTASATISITVKRTSLPTGQGFRVTTDMNKAASGQLNGSNVQNLPMTFEISSQPSNGVVSVVNTNTGAFVYQPDAGYWNLRPDANRELDSFSYTITDSHDTSLPVEVELAVNWINTPPVASGFERIVDWNSATNLTLTANDTDIDSPRSQWTIDIVNGPANGTVSIQGQNSENDWVVSYRPNNDFVGIDSFTYRLNDGDGGVSHATITLGVRLRVNAGGPALPGGWQADRGFANSLTFATSASIANVPAGIPQSLYQTERNGADFSFSVGGFRPGTYTVRLYLAEIFWTSAGARSFDIRIQGALVEQAFDPFAVAGGRYRAIVREYGNIVVSGNTFTIRGTARRDQANILGIEVIPVLPAPISTARATKALVDEEIPDSHMQDDPIVLGSSVKAYVLHGEEWIAAPEIVDGSEDSYWQGDLMDAWGITLDLGARTKLNDLGVVYEGDETPQVSAVGSVDALEWYEIDLTTWPVDALYLILYFETLNPVRPIIREIYWE